MVERVSILGSTGSVGVSTLDVIGRHPDRFTVYALSAHSNVERLAQQCQRFQPECAVMVDTAAAAALEQRLRTLSPGTVVLGGSSALDEIASATAVDVVMAAIVGGAGLASSYAAARAGKKLLLANKESLVMGGELFMEAARRHGCTILPIDSEHNAIFQCLPIADGGVFYDRGVDGIEKIVLTASGGPCRDMSLAEMEKVTPEQACAHPNWQMGRKISVDSATMLNKSLELIEASHLFQIGEERIGIVVHPQSIVHSMVYYRDGSVLAQLGNPDMRTPIAYGLSWPERIESGVASLDLLALGSLDFRAPEEDRFPCLRFGREAAREKGTAAITLNAANEVAVAAFLEQRIGFTTIADIIARALDQLPSEPLESLAQVLDADTRARALAQQLCAS